jgi:protein phosphatase
MKVLSYALTDVGRQRDHNEDNHLVKPGLGLYAVADGMGGHQAGEQASKLALDKLSSLLDSPDNGLKRDELLRSLRGAMQSVCATVYDLAQEDPQLHGMGTTLTSLWFHRDSVYLGHVGDSRAYLIRDGRAQQLSDDHSWVSEQVRAGLMTADEARTSRFRHIITRSVGFERNVSVDAMSMPVLLGDCFLLCSDGLSNYIEADEIAAVMNAHFYKNVPKVLIDMANQRGGDDNITVVLIHVANEAHEVVAGEVEAQPAQNAAAEVEPPELEATTVRLSASELGAGEGGKNGHGQNGT